MSRRRKVILKGADVAISSSDDDDDCAAHESFDDEASTDDGEIVFKAPVVAKRRSSRGGAALTKATSAGAIAAASSSPAPAPKRRPKQSQSAAATDAAGSKTAAAPASSSSAAASPKRALPTAPAPAKVNAYLSAVQTAQDGQDVACHALLWLLDDCIAAEPTAERAAAVRESLLPALQRVERTAALLRSVCHGSSGGGAGSSGDGSGGGKTKKRKKKGLEQAAEGLGERLTKLLPAEVMGGAAATAPAGSASAAAPAAAPLASAASTMNVRRGRSSGGGGSSCGGGGGGGGGGRADAKAPEKRPTIGSLQGALQDAKGKLRKTDSRRSKKRTPPRADGGGIVGELARSLALRRAHIQTSCDSPQSPCQSPGAFGTPSKKMRLAGSNR